ncbi:MAG: Mrp/NBP35 family ATP-binding protein [Sphingomicrobium sp.]
MTDSSDPPSQFPHADRIRSRKVKGGIAIIIADASGLDAAGRTALEADLRAAALAEDGISDVRIALTASDPRRTVIAIGSGKGGVGKSTVSVNLAIALARAGHKVGLIDADVYGPSQPTLLGSRTKPTASGDRLNPVDAQGISFLSLGQLVEPGQALAWRGPMAAGALLRMLEADWGDKDLLIIDLPPGTGDVQISLIQKMKPDAAVIVSTAQDLALIDAERAVDLFNRVQVPVVGLIENMAGYRCPHCGEESDPFGTGGAEEGAKRMHVPFLGRLPLSLAIRSASDAGTPPAAGEGAEADAFAALAAALEEQLEIIAR